MQTADTHKLFEMEIPVKDEDIDLLGHVNNIVYLKWVQDVAVAHWYSVASEWEKENLLWVIKRHEIDYKRSAMQNDVIIAKTWVGDASAREFQRFTELARKEDNKILASALTYWCPIDFKTKRPVKVTEDVYKRFSVNH